MYEHNNENFFGSILSTLVFVGYDNLIWFHSFFPSDSWHFCGVNPLLLTRAFQWPWDFHTTLDVKGNFSQYH